MNKIFLATFEQIGSLIVGGAMLIGVIIAAVYDIGRWLKKKIKRNGHH